MSLKRCSLTMTSALQTRSAAGTAGSRTDGQLQGPAGVRPDAAECGGRGV